MFRTLSLLAVCLALATAGEDAAQPFPRSKEYNWMSVATWQQLHAQFLERTKQGGVDLLFVGDSITQGWGNNAVWQKEYVPLKAANFGIGGDMTQNVIWRLANGEGDGLTPKAVVLMIGTNNFGLNGDQPADVIRGVTATVAALTTKFPKSHILLLGIFPRDANPKSDIRARIATVNTAIAKLHDGKRVHYLDIGPKFLAADGTLSKDVMPDFLHLSEAGYRIWADAIKPALDQLMK